MNILLLPDEIHLWKFNLSSLLPLLATYEVLLNNEEIAHANRFRFDIHRQRYILARAVLRKILSLYAHEAAAKIIFNFGKKGKPYLLHNPENIFFNLSHSNELAMIAIRSQQEIGADIEKIENNIDENIIKRFFDQQEYKALMQLNPIERIIGFYKLWSAKEALIKTLGESVFSTIECSPILLQMNTQVIQMSHQNKINNYHLDIFSPHPGYQAAFATVLPISKIIYWQWTDTGPKEWAPKC